MTQAKPKILFSEIIQNPIFCSEFVTSRIEIGFRTFSIGRDSGTDAPLHWETQYSRWLKKRHLLPSFKCQFEEDENGSSFLKEIIVGGAY